MAIPKKIKKTLNIVPGPVQGHYPSGYDGVTTPDRRKELSELITEDGTHLPQSILHADLDRGMLDFVEQQLKTVSSGKKVNVIDRILTLQRWAEFSQTWKFANQDKNVELPFIVVVRQPDAQYGSNPALQYTIPDRKQFHYAKVPTWDGNRKGYDIYTIPQPVPIDIMYDVKIVCNRMRELNNFNRVVLQKFTSKQAYTFVKGHYIPIIMQTIGDESQIDTEERRYYQQNYQFQVQGFLLDEEEFEVKPAITRSLVLFGFDEKDRKGDPKNLGKMNADKVKNKVSFIGSSNTFTINYKYKANISLIRTKNIVINSEQFFVNGVNQTKVEVSPGDTLLIQIVKLIPSQESTVTIEETLVA